MSPQNIGGQTDVTLAAADIEIGAVEIKNAVDDTRAAVGTALTEASNALAVKDASLGKVADAEAAAGDGSLIAILKRLRTLLSAGLPAALTGGGRLKVDVMVNDVQPQLDDTDKIAVSLYGQNAAAGDQAVKTDGSNHLQVAMFTGANNRALNAVDLTGDGVDPGGWYNICATSFAMLFSGTGTAYDRQRANVAVTLLTSAARTAETSSADQVNYNGRGLLVVVNVSSITSTPVLTPRLQIKDVISGNYMTVWTAAANIIATGMYAYLFTPGGAAGSFTEAVNLRVGRTFRFQMGVADADSATYSVSADVLV